MKPNQDQLMVGRSDHWLASNRTRHVTPSVPGWLQNFRVLCLGWIRVRSGSSRKLYHYTGERRWRSPTLVEIAAVLHAVYVTTCPRYAIRPGSRRRHQAAAAANHILLASKSVILMRLSHRRQSSVTFVPTQVVSHLQRLAATSEKFSQCAVSQTVPKLWN